MRALIVFIALGLSFAGQHKASASWPPLEVERLVEELVESGEGEGSVEMLLDDLSRLWQRPIDLRTQTVAQLRRLPLVAPGEAERIAQFLQDNPDVQAVQALGIALRMPPARRQLFALFYTLDAGLPRFDTTLLRRLQGDVVQRFGFRVPLFTAEPERMKKVYGDAVGTPLALLLRATVIASGRISFGFKGVKQPGEPFFYSYAPQGFPYYSAYLQLEGKRYNSPIVVLGDFSAVFGTAQTVGSYFTLIRQPNPYAWGKQGAGIRGQLGSSDNTTLRGAALQHQPLPWLSYAVALSAQPLTTSLANEKKYPGQGGRIATILSRPVYRKQQEAERHFNTWEFSAIANLQISIGVLHLGYTAIATHFNRDFMRFDSASYRLPLPAQTSMRNGLSAHLYLNSWTLWGEITLSSLFRSGKQAISGNVGLTFTPSYNLAIGLQGFYYPYNASPRYAQGVVSAPQNRAGGVANLMLRIADVVAIVMGGECTNFLNPQVLRRAPALTWRGFAEVQYTLAQGSKLDTRYRYHEYQPVRSKRTYRAAAIARIHTLRLRGDYRQGEWLSLRTTLLYAYRDGRSEPKGHHNWAVAQDLRLRLLSGHLIFTCRGAYYNCVGEGVIIALYEYAPLYSMAVSRFSRAGWRAYGMAYWEFTRGWSITFKAATTQLLSESLSELTELERQRRDMLETTLQLRWKF